MKKGYVYILSNTEKNGVVKIGGTEKHPTQRAEQLSRQTGVIGAYAVEWNCEVDDWPFYEKYLHYIFDLWHYEKEFFKIELEKAKVIAEVAIDACSGIEGLLEKSLSNCREIIEKKQDETLLGQSKKKMRKLIHINRDVRDFLKL